MIHYYFLLYSHVIVLQLLLLDEFNHGRLNGGSSIIVLQVAFTFTFTTVQISRYAVRALQSILQCLQRSFGAILALRRCGSHSVLLSSTSQHTKSPTSIRKLANIWQLHFRNLGRRNGKVLEGNSIPWSDDSTISQQSDTKHKRIREAQATSMGLHRNTQYSSIVIVIVSILRSLTRKFVVFGIFNRFLDFESPEQPLPIPTRLYYL